MRNEAGRRSLPAGRLRRTDRDLHGGVLHARPHEAPSATLGAVILELADGFPTPAASPDRARSAGHNRRHRWSAAAWTRAIREHDGPSDLHKLRSMGPGRSSECTHDVLAGVGNACLPRPGYSARRLVPPYHAADDLHGMLLWIGQRDNAALWTAFASDPAPAPRQVPHCGAVPAEFRPPVPADAGLGAAR